MANIRRAGKVKNMTPIVQKQGDSKYNGGRKKYKKKISSNLTYSSGSTPLDKSTFNDALHQMEEKTPKLEQFGLMDGHTEPCLLNSYPHYNTTIGFNRIEFMAIRKEQKAEPGQYSIDDPMYKYSFRNHKKWHRNHHEEVYQLREVFDVH